MGWRAQASPGPSCWARARGCLADGSLLCTVCNVLYFLAQSTLSGNGVAESTLCNHDCCLRAATCCVWFLPHCLAAVPLVMLQRCMLQTTALLQYGSGCILGRYCCCHLSNLVLQQYRNAHKDRVFMMMQLECKCAQVAVHLICNWACFMPDSSSSCLAIERCCGNTDMRKGEKARLMVRPEYGYAMKDCKVTHYH